MPKLFKLTVIPLALIFVVANSFAATLAVTKIGVLDTTGKDYAEWWYMGSGPTFEGTADANSTVTIKINDTSYTTTANDSGMWAYTASLETADYNVSFSQGEQSESFVLHMGQAFTGEAITTEASATTTPETGFNQLIAFGFGVGTLLLAVYFYSANELKSKVSFEKRMLEKD